MIGFSTRTRPRNSPRTRGKHEQSHDGAKEADRKKRGVFLGAVEVKLAVKLGEDPVAALEKLKGFTETRIAALDIEVAREREARKAAEA